MKKLLFGIFGLIIIVGLIGALGEDSPELADEPAAASEPEPVTEIEEPEEEPAPVPNPKGTIKGSCDYILGDFTESASGYRFIADGTVKNTGNIGIVVETKAIWFLSGGGKVTDVKRTRLDVGRSKRLGFMQVATSDQIDLHQSLGFSSKTCDLKIKLTDTFGEPRA